VTVAEPSGTRLRAAARIFDVEAVFIFPWAAAMERYGWFGLIAMGLFIVLLLDGLVYAWKRGLLRWV
jgi:NADH-quinone oxidoreductase subunit A